MAEALPLQLRNKLLVRLHLLPRCAWPARRAPADPDIAWKLGTSIACVSRGPVRVAGWPTVVTLSFILLSGTHRHSRQGHSNVLVGMVTKWAAVGFCTLTRCSTPVSLPIEQGGHLLHLDVKPYPYPFLVLPCSRLQLGSLPPAQQGKMAYVRQCACFGQSLR